MIAAGLLLTEWGAVALVVVAVAAGLGGDPTWFAVAAIALAIGLFARAAAGYRARMAVLDRLLPRPRPQPLTRTGEPA